MESKGKTIAARALRQKCRCVLSNPKKGILPSSVHTIVELPLGNVQYQLFQTLLRLYAAVSNRKEERVWPILAQNYFQAPWLQEWNNVRQVSSDQQ